jgi:chromosome segregation ATPase
VRNLLSSKLRARPPQKSCMNRFVTPVRSELEAKVATSQEELSGMRKWCLAALGEAEKRTAAFREQAMVLQRRLGEETKRTAEALNAQELTVRKLQEEKKLKLMVYGQTLAKHKEMSQEATQSNQSLRHEVAARSSAEHQLDECTEENRQIRSQLDALEAEFHLQLTKQHEETASRCADYETQTGDLAAALSAERDTCSKLRVLQSGGEQSLQELQTRFGEAEAASTAKDHHIDELTATVAKLEARVNEQGTQLQQFASENQEMQRSLVRETEAERHLSDRVAELGHLLQAESERLRHSQQLLADAEERVRVETSRYREELSKRELADAEVKRMSSLQELPPKLLAKEAECNEMQVKLGSLEAQREVSRASCSTWKEDHGRLLDETRRKEQEWQEGRHVLQAAITATTEQCEARVTTMQAAMVDLTAAKDRLQCEVATLTEESGRFSEMQSRSVEQIDALRLQLDNTTKQYQSKEAEVARFGQMTAELTHHIGELETSETKTEQLLESTAAERLRLSDELKVATQQLEMMREVTRQLYAKTTEQTESFSRLAEAKAAAESQRHQLELQHSDARQRQKLELANRVEAERKLSRAAGELTQMSAQNDAVAHQLDALSTRLRNEVAAREAAEERYRRLHHKYSALSTEAAAFSSHLLGDKEHAGV